MEEAFLICFFVGFFFTFITFLFSGVFGGHDADAGDADVDVGDADVDVDVGDVDVDAGDVDVGVDHDADFDMGHDFDHSVAEAGGDGHVEVGVTDSFPGLSPWSPTILSAFVTSFGGVGYLILTETGGGIPLSLLGGLVTAFLFAYGLFLVMNRIFTALQSSSEVHAGGLRGKTAVVVTPIPEGGVGEISYEAEGTRLSSPARTTDGKPVGRAEKVKIVRVTQTVYYVKPC